MLFLRKGSGSEWCKKIQTKFVSLKNILIFAT